ncbi:MAG: SMC-Scp complex subunit ScpB [Proteobacteria bacterium]|nr:SMC-Scp complex subunit ScpB [Pseudomonadota bacterium]
MQALTGADERVQRLGRATRIAEALLFAAREPLSEDEIGRTLPAEVEVGEVLRILASQYEGRGVTLSRLAGKWAFQTAPDLGYLLSGTVDEPKKLSRAGLETLAVIAYHQPVTRAEIEDIRGLQLSRGMLDMLLEAGWVKMRGRRRTPGRPVTYGTTEAFLIQFGLDRLSDLPGLEEMKGAGLTEGEAPGFTVPLPSDDPALREDEDALEPDLFEQMTEDRLAEEDPPLETADELPQEEDASGTADGRIFKDPAA